MVSKCDTREPHSDSASIASRLVALGWRMEKLEYGDYWLDCSLDINPIVERKRIDNFIGDMKDGTLTRQARALCDSTPFPILIREGAVYLSQDGRKLRDWPEVSLEALRNQEMTLQNMGCRLERTNDVADTILRLQELVRYFGKETHESALRQMPGDYRLASLHLIPGIGESKGKAIIARFQSLAQVAVASQQDLANCEGIGYKLAERIWHYFNDRRESNGS